MNKCGFRAVIIFFETINFPDWPNKKTAKGKLEMDFVGILNDQMAGGKHPVSGFERWEMIQLSL